MDRYWIAKEHKITIPSQDEIKKYHEEEYSKPKKSPLVSKAEICAEIIKLKQPRYSEKEIVHDASALMNLNMDQLLKLRENYRQTRKIKSDRRS